MGTVTSNCPRLSLHLRFYVRIWRKLRFSVSQAECRASHEPSSRERLIM